MASISGTSTADYQRLVNFQTLSVPQFEVVFPTTPTIRATRVGYAYILVVAQSTPFQTRLLKRYPIYQPGTFEVFPTNYGFSVVRYTLDAVWDRPGLPWTVNYS